MLTKDELASIGDGASLDADTVFMYRVYGIYGEEAYLSNLSPREPAWQFRRFKNEAPLSDWKGDFRSADDALSALEKEVNEEKRKR